MPHPRKHAHAASNFVPFDHVTYLLPLPDASSFLPFSSCVLHASPPTHRCSPSLSRCHAVDPFPFTTKFPSSSHHLNRPSPLSHAGHVARGPEQVGHHSGSHLYVGKVFLLYMGIFNLSFCTFPISPFTLDHLLFIPESPLILGPFTISDTAPLTYSSSTHPSSRT